MSNHASTTTQYVIANPARATSGRDWMHVRWVYSGAGAAVRALEHCQLSNEGCLLIAAHEANVTTGKLPRGLKGQRTWFPEVAA